jgi:Flp pilus assembly protein TadG
MTSRIDCHRLRQTESQRPPTASVRADLSSRRGAVSVWLIIAAPAMFVLTVLMSDLANLWIARIELEHSLESAALAAVEHWGKGNTITASRTAGVAFALANNVRGVPVVITANGGGPAPNENASCSGNLVFGNINTGTSTFNAGLAPGTDFGVKAQATRNVLSLWKPVFGLSQPYKVSAQTFAYFNSTTTGPARLVNITTFTCP